MRIVKFSTGLVVSHICLRWHFILTIDSPHTYAPPQQVIYTISRSIASMCGRSMALVILSREKFVDGAHGQTIHRSSDDFLLPGLSKLIVEFDGRSRFQLKTPSSSASPLPFLRSDMNWLGNMLDAMGSHRHRHYLPCRKGWILVLLGAVECSRGGNTNDIGSIGFHEWVVYPDPFGIHGFPNIEDFVKELSEGSLEDVSLQSSAPYFKVFE